MMLYCKKCNRIIMNATKNGGYKIRSRMILFNNGRAEAICPQCKTKNYVPIFLSDAEGLLERSEKIFLKG